MWLIKGQKEIIFTLGELSNFCTQLLKIILWICDVTEKDTGCRMNDTFMLTDSNAGRKITRQLLRDFKNPRKILVEFYSNKFGFLAKI